MILKDDKKFLIKLSCMIHNERDNPEVMRSHNIAFGDLNDLERLSGWHHAILHILELMRDIYTEKRQLPTLDEAQKMYYKAKKQHKQFAEFLDKRIEKLELESQIKNKMSATGQEVSREY